MNKGRRQELTVLRWVRRLKAMKLDKRYYAFKHQGRPCNCSTCSKPKYTRAKSKKLLKQYDEEV